jgi:autotransporter adhesin
VPSWRRSPRTAPSPAPSAASQPAAPARDATSFVAIHSTSGPPSATGEHAIAVGAHASAGAQDAFAGGRHARADGARSLALGADAHASGQRAVALGAGAVADRDNTVSVGRPGDERQIAHIAAGTHGTDAVNVAQLGAAMSNARTYTEQRLGDLQHSITETARNAYSGVAGAAALAMLPDVDRDKTLSIGVGGAVYKGHRAVALGGTARIGENLKIKAGVALSAGGNTVGIGMSWQW